MVGDSVRLVQIDSLAEELPTVAHSECAGYLTISPTAIGPARVFTLQPAVRYATTRDLPDQWLPSCTYR